MSLRHLTKLTLLVTTLGGCNNPLSKLDRGQIKVNGLSKPQQLATPIIKNANQGEAIRTGEYQTRQSVSFIIPEDVALQGNQFTLKRTAPEPSQDISAKATIPASGSAVTSGDVTMERLASGGAKISFYAGTLVNSKSLVYGDNTLQLTMYSDDVATYQVDIIIKVRDFTIAGPAMVGMLKSQPDAVPSGRSSSESWISTLKQTTVSDTQEADSPSSLLRTGLMSIIHP